MGTVTLSWWNNCDSAGCQWTVGGVCGVVRRNSGDTGSYWHCGTLVVFTSGDSNDCSAQFGGSRRCVDFLGIMWHNRCCGGRSGGSQWAVGGVSG